MKALLTTTMVLLAGFAGAQSLEKTTVANAGTAVKKSSISLQYTIGELAVSNFSNSSLQLNQGFNQGRKVGNASVKTILANQKLHVYPNPTFDRLNIKSTYEAKVDIVSAQGQVVQNNIAVHKEQLQTLNVSHLSKGVYFIRMRTNQGMQMAKWVKQ